MDAIILGTQVVAFTLTAPILAVRRQATPLLLQAGLLALSVLSIFYAATL